ncbi:hypothetical protein [Novosphingobium percolationis]|uniref:hypothetical protein n=1 Tax=Novosphingobium percolationis TaxID=2871811 RepID=UPI001CD5618B|nr:hypothetical protein [Novosphingobium percolationis]
MNALMSDFEIKHDARPLSPRWEGLAELDRALAEDRLTAYRWKKAWADPINRLVIIAVCLILLAYVGFVIVNDLLV